MYTTSLFYTASVTGGGGGWVNIPKASKGNLHAGYKGEEGRKGGREREEATLVYQECAAHKFITHTQFTNHSLYSTHHLLHFTNCILHTTYYILQTAQTLIALNTQVHKTLTHAHTNTHCACDDVLA